MVCLGHTLRTHLYNEEMEPYIYSEDRINKCEK